MNRIVRTYLPTVLSIILLSGSLANAQSFLGSIVGTVKDASGGIVPEAQVTLAEVTTGIQRTAKTNLEGNYGFSDLPPGTYTVTVSKEAFKETRSSNIILTANEIGRFDAVLEVGSTTQTIEVKALAPTLNTENGQVSGVLSNNELNILPVVARSTVDMIMLNSNNYMGDGSSYSLGGIRGSDTNFTIDGVSSNSAVFGAQVGPMTQESIDSVGELKTLVSNNSAEYPSVGTLMIATRSGTNQLHGDLFDIENNWALDTRGFFASSRPKGPVDHDFGADIGGPVVIPHVYNGHNKTFFHFTYEGDYQPGEYSGTAQEPTPLMQEGNFSELLPASGATPAGSICAANPNFCYVITDPTTGQPFTGNIIPPGEITQVSKNLQQFGFVPPNSLSQFPNGYDWVGLFPSSSHDNRYVVRVDHQASSKDSISFRSSIRQIPEPLQFFGSVPQFYFNESRSTQNLFLGWTHSFNPNLINEFRVGFSRDAANLADSHADGVATTQALGFTGIDYSTRGGLSGFPLVGFNNFSSWNGALPTYFWRTQTWEFLDNLSFIKGKHTLKGGILLRMNQINISQCCSSDFGSVSFDGFATGLDYADFLLGLPHFSSLFTRTIPSTPQYDEWGLYVQDNYQVSDKLTLNLGLRWDYFPSPVDKNDLVDNFDLSNGAVVLASPKSQQYVSPLFAAAGVVSPIPFETASAAGMPARTLMNNDTTNLGPRVGFAYRLFGNNRTVLRGGWGMYYVRLAYTRTWNFGGGPFVSNESFTNSVTGGVPVFQFPDPFTGVGSIGTQSVSPLSPNLRTPRNQQWNLTLEHQFPHSIVTSITYRGLKGTQIPYAGDINKPLPSGTTGPETGENFFRYPNFYSVGLLQDGAIQNLNAMDLTVERKFSQGLTFHSGWTWAHNLTDTTPDGEGPDSSIQNPYDRAVEYGNVDYMPRHRWVSYAIYDLPFGKGKHFASGVSSDLNQLVGGWQMSAVTLFQTGQFLTPTFDSLDPSNTRTYGGRADCVGNPYPASQSISGWLNLSGFALPPDGRFGNCGNGVLEGPGLANFDFGFFKYFSVKERLKIQLRMTSNNILNHPNFSNPNTDTSSGNFGTITGQAGGKRDTLGGGPRQILLGLRIEF
jgi:hypothetical protein